MDIDSSLALSSIIGTEEQAFYINLLGSDIDLNKLSITLTDVDFTDGTILDNVYIQSEGITYAAEIAWRDQQATTRNLVVGAAIPEPTTATLSILALAALAGRRRRR